VTVPTAPQSLLPRFLEQHMATGPGGVHDYADLPEIYRGRPGLMDYSLLVGLAPAGTPGGLTRLEVLDTHHQMLESGEWSLQVEEKVVFLGIVDVLQFWTPRKRIARGLKKWVLGMECDEDGSYHGEILDTLAPEPYKERFMRFLRATFSSGSWLYSLPKLCDGDWAQVLVRQIQWLPEAQQAIAMSHHEQAVSSDPRRKVTQESLSHRTGRIANKMARSISTGARSRARPSRDLGPDGRVRAATRCPPDLEERGARLSFVQRPHPRAMTLPAGRGALPNDDTILTTTCFWRGSGGT